LARLRQPWVRGFLAEAWGASSPKTRAGCLGQLARFDQFLLEHTPVQSGQRSLVSGDHISVYLAEHDRHALTQTRAFFI
jgi:hypothetical protein